MAASPAPEGRRVLAPYLAVEDAAKAIDFYQRAFGATERSRIPGPGGTIAHVELELWGLVLMLADPLPQFVTRPPKEVGATTVSVFAYVDDVDAVFRRAIDAGATSNTEPADMFWGDPLRDAHRSLRPRVAPRDPGRGRPARRAGGAQQSGHGRYGRLEPRR